MDLDLVLFNGTDVCDIRRLEDDEGFVEQVAGEYKEKVSPKLLFSAYFARAINDGAERIQFNAIVNRIDEVRYEIDRRGFGLMSPPEQLREGLFEYIEGFVGPVACEMNGQRVGALTLVDRNTNRASMVGVVCNNVLTGRRNYLFQFQPVYNVPISV